MVAILKLDTFVLLATNVLFLLYELKLHSA